MPKPKPFRYPVESVRLMLVRDAPGSARAVQYAKTPADTFALLAPVMSDMATERFVVVLLDTRSKVLGIVNVADGGLNACPVDPRVVFGAALVSGASAIIVAHNHPSGDPEPSPEDLKLTHKLAEGARILGLQFLDHLIVGEGRYTSFVERGLLD